MKLKLKSSSSQSYAVAKDGPFIGLICKEEIRRIFGKDQQYLDLEISKKPLKGSRLFVFDWIDLILKGRHIVFEYDFGRFIRRNFKPGKYYVRVT